MKDQYRKFLETGQSAKKLRLALEGLFSEEINGSEETREIRDAYEAYLRKRIRPAAAFLIEENETEKLLKLESQGFFGQKELEEFLRLALEQKRIPVWLELLKLKQEKYGFAEKEYLL